MRPEDNSVLCFLVVTMLNELKVLDFLLPLNSPTHPLKKRCPGC